MEGLIKIEDYKIHCCIGIHPYEKESEQEIAIDLEMKVDFSEAVQSDSIADTVDYSEVANVCRTVAKERKYHLLETFGYEILNAILNDFPVSWVKIRVKKKHALALAKDTVIELERSK